MASLALKQEATALLNQLSEADLYATVLYMQFIEHQKKSKRDSEMLAKAERDRHDVEIINANAEYLNQGAEENLEFQADIWEDE